MADTGTTGLQASAILEFWLGPENERDAPAPEIRRRWYAKSDEFDARLRREFGADLQRAHAGELDAWGQTPRGLLALVILLDQFSRNVHRGSGRMFEHDDRALALAKQGVGRGDDTRLKAAECQFLYMPFMHSEAIDDQRHSIELFDRLARVAPGLDCRSWAQSHHDIVARFGRFPHRNALLGRNSTDVETEFLKQPNSGF
jgi:uncharacterized protein (DUF924 family)